MEFRRMIQRGGRCREAPAKSSARRQHLPRTQLSRRHPFFSRPTMRSKVAPGAFTVPIESKRGWGDMEQAMRRILAAGLMMMGGMLAGAPAQADWVPPF